MTRDDIQKEFDAFFEFPTAEKSIVTTVSAMLFAEHVARKVAAAEREACAKVCDQTESDLWGVYKGRSKNDRLGRGRGSEYVQGGSDTAGLLAEAIRARSNQ